MSIDSPPFSAVLRGPARPALSRSAMRRWMFAAVIAAVAACGGKPNETKTPQDHAVGSGVATVPPSAGSGATTPPAPKFDPNEQLGMDPSVRHGVLPNGMTYYVKHNPKPEKRVQLWLAVNSGAVLENDDERGYSHLIEHIAFQGTKRFPKHDIQDFIEMYLLKGGEVTASEEGVADEP